MNLNSAGEAYMKVSVVIPVYNRERTIKRCIDSVINQNYEAFEIIVVDDGSTDNTLRIIEEEYVRIVRVIKQNHKGAQAARNAGIRAAKGEYIAFLDSDDEWMPDKLKIQVEALKEDVNAVVCGNGFVQTDWEGGVPKVYDIGKQKNRTRAGKRRILRLQGKNGNVYKHILCSSFCMFQALLTSRKNLIEIGLLDEKVPSYQEWDTAIRLAKGHEFVFINKPLFVYHLHDGDTISKSMKKSIDGLEYIYEKHLLEIISQLGSSNMTQKYKDLMRKCIEYRDKRAVKYFVKYILGKMNVFILK